MFSHQYPDGDICFDIYHVTKKPLMAWASEANGKRARNKTIVLVCGYVHHLHFASSGFDPRCLAMDRVRIVC